MSEINTFIYYTCYLNFMTAADHRKSSQFLSYICILLFIFLNRIRGCSMDSIVCVHSGVHLRVHCTFPNARRSIYIPKCILKSHHRPQMILKNETDCIFSPSTFHICDIIIIMIIFIIIGASVACWFVWLCLIPFNENIFHDPIIE